MFALAPAVRYHASRRDINPGRDPMLNRTFIHIPRIGHVTERRLWQAGVRTWDEALSLSRPPRGFSGERWGLICDLLQSSLFSLATDDHRHFARCLRARDQWRAFPDFRRRVAYLDIETDGLNHWNAVTVVGVYDGVRTRTYVAGDNLDAFAEDIRDFALLVTFNGATFDIPFLRRRFGDIFDHLHVDLRFALGQLGCHGGLKTVERQLGIERPGAIADISGEDAVRLWREYRRGSMEALALLIEYNRADVENLELLMEIAYARLWARAQGAPESVP